MFVVLGDVEMQPSKFTFLEHNNDYFVVFTKSL